MILNRVPLDTIDFGDESYRISDLLECARMRASLEAVGQINPAVLLDRGGRKAIVCGFRRLHALRHMGATDVLARTEQESRPPLAVFSLALMDNLAHRVFTELEYARILTTLETVCRLSHEVLVTTYLPMLGLRPHVNVLRGYLSLQRLVPELRGYLRQGRITLSSAQWLARLPGQVQTEFAGILDNVRLSAGFQKKVLDLLEELGGMTPGGVGEVINAPEIASTISAPGLSPWQRGEKIHEILYRFRNPRLSRARERFRARKADLGLPGAVSLTPDPFFERPRIKVDFEFSSPGEFRTVAAALQDAAQHANLEALFETE